LFLPIIKNTGLPPRAEWGVYDIGGLWYAIPSHYLKFGDAAF
jgi:hypothetical protein